MEKQLSGKAMEKFPDYKTVSVSMKRNGTKESTCEDCGIISTVRKDTNPKVCQRCASVRGSKANETNGDNPCNSLNHGRQIAL